MPFKIPIEVQLLLSRCTPLTPATPNPCHGPVLFSAPCPYVAPGLFLGHVSACLEHKDPGSRVLGSWRKESKGKRGRTRHKSQPKSKREEAVLIAIVPLKLNPQTSLNSDSDFQRTRKKPWEEAPPQVGAASLFMTTLGKQVSIPTLP